MTARAILVLCMLAAALPLARAEEPQDDAQAGAAEAAKVEALALNPLAALDKAALDGFRDAPLFTPSRTRPTPPPPPVAEAPPPPPPPEEPSPPEPPTLKLAGIAEGPEGAVAFVSKEGEETVQQLRLGDQIDGWLVTTIEPSALKLTLDQQEQEYRMFLRPDADEPAAGGDQQGDKSSDDDDDQDDAQDAQMRQQQQNVRRSDAARKAQENARRTQRRPQ